MGGETVESIENYGSHVVIKYISGSQTILEAKVQNNFPFIEEVEILPPEIEEEIENYQEEFNWETV